MKKIAVSLVFDPSDAATWPLVLTIRQVALIYQQSEGSIRQHLKPSHGATFTPAPFKRGPYRWRKADVLRDVQGARLGRTA